MRILLIPSLDVQNGKLANYVPYGLLILQAMARDHQTGVDIWRPSPAMAANEFPSADSLCDAVLSSVDPGAYDVIGFSTVTSSFLFALRLAQRIKEDQPEVRLIVGGPYVTKLAEEILSRFSFIEAVFVGESEYSFSAFLGRCDEGLRDFVGIPGVATRNGMPPANKTAQLDDLPWIADAPDFLQWFRLRNPHPTPTTSIPLEVTRGCPLQCSFCSTRQVWGAQVRRKSVGRLVEEMTVLSRVCGSTFFNLIGDNVGVPRAPFLQFCDELAMVNPGFTWGCSLKVDRLEPEHLRRMWDAGMRAMFVGLESGNQETLDKVRKKTNIAKEIANIRSAIELGFRVTTSFIIGFPWEEPGDVESTLRLHSDLVARGVDRSQINILIPIPGTDIVSSGKVLFEPWWLKSIAAGGGASTEEIEEATSSHPDLFSHFGRYETPHIETNKLLATVIAAKSLLRTRAAPLRPDWNTF